MRSLVDRIELRPNQQGKLEIDLYGDLAGILPSRPKERQAARSKRPVSSAG
jgi:hypothetical protein